MAGEEEEVEEEGTSRGKCFKTYEGGGLGNGI